MRRQLNRAIEAWEDEGGATRCLHTTPRCSLRGTEAQVEWAERIRSRVAAEFERVAASFRAIAERQTGQKQAETEAIIAIAQDCGDAVLQRQEAGYFIHEWQDISDQVRQMIFHDARYQAIKSRRTSRPLDS